MLVAQGFAAWLETTSLREFLVSVRWLWALCETLHFFGVALLIGIAGFFDLRLMGFMRSVPISTAKTLMPWAIWAFVINLGTGIVFFLTFPARYTDNGAFWAKMLFIVIAGLNAMFFETRLGSRVLDMEAGEDTPTSFKIVGALSLFSWLAVLYFGRMLPYLWQGVF
jgi:hypothetical protein